MMKYLLSILLILFAVNSWGFAPGFLPTATNMVAAVGGGTTFGPTAITTTENDSTTGDSPPNYNYCLDSDGSPVGGVDDSPMGVRWASTGITQGATITDSELRVYIGFPTSGIVTMRVYGNAVAAASDFAAAGTIVSRTRTTAYADFTLTAPGWTTLNSSALDSVIQEVASNSGFDGTVALFLIDQNGGSDIQDMQVHTRSTASCGTNFATLEVTWQ